MIEQIKKMVSEHPDTKDLINLSANDYYVCYEYIKAKAEGNPNYQPILMTSPYLHIEYKPTAKKIDETKLSGINQKLKKFSSDIYIANAQLDEFILSDEYRKKLVSKMNSFLKEFPKTYQQGLYIYGDYGTGKSFFLSALATHLVEKRINVIYIFMPDLTRQIKSDFTDLERKIIELKNCDVLILDDLGGENITAWFRDEILLPVLHYRLNAQKPVFISSNYALSKLGETIMHSTHDNDGIKTMRLIRRIQDLTITIKLHNQFKLP